MPDLLPWPASLDPTGKVFVPGTPVPQGSHKAFIVGGYARITESNKAVNPWRADVHAAVRTVTGNHLVFPVEPVALTLLFVMPRRATEPKRVTPPHVRKPDGDKLARAIADSLTGLIYRDDSQVTATTWRKRTASIGEIPGAHIEWRHDG
jgi:Holliday junction resolvase RusA-like endonuclease